MKHIYQPNNATAILAAILLTLFVGTQSLSANNCTQVCKKIYSCTLMIQSGNASTVSRLKRNKAKVLKNCVKGCKKNVAAAVGCYKKSGAGVTAASCQSIASCMMPYLQK